MRMLDVLKHFPLMRTDNKQADANCCNLLQEAVSKCTTYKPRMRRAFTATNTKPYFL